MQKLIVVVAVFLLVLVVFFCRYFVFRSLDGHGMLRHAREQTEINQLAEALNGCKAIYGRYPPCMAEPDAAIRKYNFLRYLTDAYPTALYGGDSSSFDELNQKVQTKWGYNFRNSDRLIVPLDLERLDAAEALVFWLGGFPTPYDTLDGTPIAPTKLFGFHKDRNNPLKRDLKALSQNVEANKIIPERALNAPNHLVWRTGYDLFAFDPSLLVDQDNDGWWEYVLQRPENGEISAPVVYFDWMTVLTAATHRDTLGDCCYPHSPSLAARWGTAAPYAVNFNPANSNRTAWANDRSFQLIHAGRDGKYGPPGNGVDLPPRRVTELKPGLPSFTSADGFQKAQPADLAEKDNLSNLSSRTVGDAAEKTTAP